MRITTRIKLSGILSIVVLTIMIGTFMLSGLLSRAQITHAAGVSSYKATTGLLTPAAIVDPGTLASDTTPISKITKAMRHLSGSTCTCQRQRIVVDHACVGFHFDAGAAGELQRCQ